MDPEERREDAEDFVREWRDEMRAKLRQSPNPRRLRRVWMDTGSGPGFSVLTPRGSEDE